MRFPDWAPKKLCEYYNKAWQDYPKEGKLLLRRPLTKEEKLLLKRLLTNPSMIPVWEAFEKAHKKRLEKLEG
jgi:hypothetical protein